MYQVVNHYVGPVPWSVVFLQHKGVKTQDHGPFDTRARTMEQQGQRDSNKDVANGAEYISRDCRALLKKFVIAQYPASGSCGKNVHLEADCHIAHAVDCTPVH